MKTKDINKIKELIAERLDDQYEIKANWNEVETRNGEPMWVHKDDTFEISAPSTGLRERLIEALGLQSQLLIEAQLFLWNSQIEMVTNFDRTVCY